MANIVNVSRNECDGITFLQTQDIVCDAGHSPIGYQGDSDHSYFRGTYDGQGHTVSGITVTRTGNTNADQYIGLFGCVYWGTVQNVVLANSTFTGYRYVGGIAGYNSWGTVRNCRVESSVTIKGGYGEGSLFGGVVGYLAGTEALISGCVSAATIDRNGSESYKCGGIVGHVDYSTIKDCLYIGTSVTGSSNVGSIAGEKTGGTISNNYYTAISLGGVGAYTGAADQDGARRARTVTLGEGITLSGTETTYDLSGITAYGSTAIGYGGKIYSGEGQTLTLNYTVPAGYTLSYTVTRTSNGSDVTASVLSGTTLTMPAYDITVTANVSANASLNVTASSSTVFGEFKYVATFYNGTLDYQLPEGAKAYTASLDGTDVVFHLIGNDGSVIPRGTAVIIVADAVELTLTKLDSTEVTAHAGNILVGSDTEIAKPAGNVYVLGIVEGAVGFYKYSGSTIPAGKAYYVVNE